ncbi:MAG: hypothetical protein HZA32_18860 [Opitutae bacterium]|nr:hypothetical protein [Opitutae bacterium]
MRSRLPTLALLAGLLAGFALAVFLGAAAEGYSKPDRFRRFHPFISPESLFYPTFASLENLALAHWQPGKTLVIVGGNSVLNGVGQPEDRLWSLRLQELLGPNFVVVNLSFRGAFPSEAGALVAESLLRRDVPVVYIANTSPGGVVRAFEGFYRHFFWAARARGALHDWPLREKDLSFRLASLPDNTRREREEEMRGAALDRWFHFQALWQHVAYRYAFTVWNRVTGTSSWRARDAFPDDETPPPPVAERFGPNLVREMEIVRSVTAPLATPTPNGGWSVDTTRLASAGDDLEKTFPPSLRPRMLMLLSQSSPYHRTHLTAAERARDDAVFAAYAALWREHGIASAIYGTDFAVEDFHDRTHLTPSGGDKLAELVAREIRSLAQKKP